MGRLNDNLRDRDYSDRSHDAHCGDCNRDAYCDDDRDRDDVCGDRHHNSSLKI